MIAEAVKTSIATPTKQRRKYLVNAFSLSMLEISDDIVGVGLFTKKLTKEEFCNEARSAASAIGHQGTAGLISALCGAPVEATRASIKLRDGDELVVIQIKERLPEGKVLTQEELENLLNEGKIEFIKLKVRYAVRGCILSGGNNVDTSYDIYADRVMIGYWGKLYEFEALVFDKQET